MSKRVPLRITAVVLAAAGKSATARTPTTYSRSRAVSADAISGNAYFSRGMMRSIKWLDLTSRQLRQIRAVVADELPTTEPLIREFIATRARLNSALRRNRFDAEVLKLDARLSEIIVEQITIKNRLYARILLVLNERQRTKAEALIKSFETYAYQVVGERHSYRLAA